ncbi:MAG: PKD domain-containing protein, partial [Actinomycetota bacterium]|nr:PKD domain-containing protein [Actinomycetota bacterium]
VLEGEFPLANGDFGPAQPALGIDASADRLGDVAIAFVQGGAADRRLVAAHWDRPLRAVTPSTATQAWRSERRPRLTWGNATELWGPATYRIEINGFPVSTQASNVLDVPVDLPDGSHTWRIVTIDRRAQETPGLARRLNIDTTPPIAHLLTTGTLRAGQSLRFVAEDNPPEPAPGAPPLDIRTSGMARMTASFGDRTRASGTREVRHIYRKKGRYRVRIVVRDRAGNQSIVKMQVKVANPRKRSRSR